MKRFTSSRSAPPAPLDLSNDRYSTFSTSDSTRPCSGDYSNLPAFGEEGHPFYRRNDSYTSSAKSLLQHRRPISWKKPSSPGIVNANSYCGRHSSQWLFSGWGIFRKGST